MRVHGRGGRGAGLHVPVVGRAPAPEPRHGRDALLRRADPARAHGRPHRAGPGDGKELAEHYEAGYELGPFPAELLEENKWLAARYGMQGELIDLPQSARVPTAELARRLVERLRPHARELGSEREFEVLEDLIERGTGADRQLAEWRANRDMVALVRAIVEATAAGVTGRVVG